MPLKIKTKAANLKLEFTKLKNNFSRVRQKAAGVPFLFRFSECRKTAEC